MLLRFQQSLIFISLFTLSIYMTFFPFNKLIQYVLLMTLLTTAVRFYCKFLLLFKLVLSVIQRILYTGRTNSSLSISVPPLVSVDLYITLIPLQGGVPSLQILIMVTAVRCPSICRNSILSYKIYQRETIVSYDWKIWNRITQFYIKFIFSCTKFLNDYT